MLLNFFNLDRVRWEDEICHIVLDPIACSQLKIYNHVELIKKKGNLNQTNQVIYRKKKSNKSEVDQKRRAELSIGFQSFK